MNAYELNSAKHDYVSPSDNILSPCTKKLAVYKGRQFMKCVPFFSSPSLSLARFSSPLACNQSIIIFLLYFPLATYSLSFLFAGAKGLIGFFGFGRAKPQSLFAKQVGRNMGAGGAEAEGGVGEGKEGV